MKLLTHNMLTSRCIKGVTLGYPLFIRQSEVKLCQVDFNPEFVTRIISKLDWKALYQAAETLGHAGDLPQTIPPNPENDEQFLKSAHHALLEIEVLSGELECPETGRKFPISNGIPNMLLNEDEV